ncbi:hypothetical protein SAMN06269301_3004 [Geobacter sp. DSM 9736]|nr:hypothetical protein SAMN06269301_3004 [Geobacter sp. DSM 9736]
MKFGVLVTSMRRMLVAFPILLLIAGCAPSARVSSPPGFVLPEQEVMFVAPFISTLVPEAVSGPVFDDFVDILNARQSVPGVKFFSIIKDDLSELDSEWLAKNAYITGELWSYIENSGCCSTELRIKARISVHRPGENETLDIFVPLEGFFEHDRSTIEVERARLARRLASELANRLISSLASPI